MQNNDSKAQTSEFKGRRTLVTGGTKGIGAAIVDRLIRGGADVIATARSVLPAKRALLGTDCRHGHLIND